MSNVSPRAVGHPRYQIDITFANDGGGAVAQMRTAFAQGRVADLTLATLAPNGQVQQQCIYRNATMSSFALLAGASGAPPSYRADVIYQSTECTRS